MRRKYRVFAGTFSVLTSVVLAFTLLIQSSLPDRFYLTEGEQFDMSSDYGLSQTVKTVEKGIPLTGGPGESYQVDLRLFGAIAVKNVQVQVVPKQYVIPGGFPFGIKMFTDGVMVVGISDLLTPQGKANPAQEAGIHMGDVILQINGQTVLSNEDVAEIIGASAGRPVTLVMKRKEDVFPLQLKPVLGEDGTYKAGIWVRDSSAGIGTMTFLDPATNTFGGLGHGVCDVDTGEILPLSSGEIVEVSITGVEKGKSGQPGELKGSFGRQTIGTLGINGETGVFGRMQTNMITGDPVPLAMRQEVKEGPAVLYTTLEGTEPQEYAIEIERVYFGDGNPTKNMIIRITDPRLLAETGGIVQGMSGSPILQNGKLVGAVTHVFVNDPTKGYAIFAENMETTRSILIS